MMPSLHTKSDRPSGRFDVDTRYRLYVRRSRDEEDGRGRHAGARSPAGTSEQQERTATTSMAPAPEQGINPARPRQLGGGFSGHRRPIGDGSKRSISEHHTEARRSPRDVDPGARPRAPPRIREDAA